ncbi:hypothetical protein AVEN_266219-1 [Araneus ventricosus]|uniref:Uncharacterized protein n=1 Tax=Araneus ventricosus TaxID=182803 RepID=A0A4Y2Q2Y5_ARAVE|nr:hypothetical protein AVEN_266219-1 [Araneus ventricosus]
MDFGSDENRGWPDKFLRIGSGILDDSFDQDETKDNDNNEDELTAKPSRKQVTEALQTIRQGLRLIPNIPERKSPHWVK